MQEERTEIIETPRTTTREVREVDSTPHVTEVHDNVPGTRADQVESFAYDPYEGRRLAAYRMTQLVYWVFGLVEGLILIRAVLKALGANPAAGFAQLIYGLTAPLVGPFVGLFNNPAYQGSVLELSSIVALIVYGLLAWLIARLVWILLGETRSAVRTRRTQVDSRV
ncbi:MAG TPA: YggT family protein [Chloroflexota bacterium]